MIEPDASDHSPTKRVLSLGAGVQSTAILLLIARGALPPIDAAIFSDTGWEPPAVYDHLDKIDDRIAKPAGIPILRVTSGNIRNDALDPEKRFATMPLYVLGPCQRCEGSGTEDEAEWGAWDEAEDNYITFPAYAGKCRKCEGTGKQAGMAHRQCTAEYKVKPIKRAVRELLGYPHPTPVPKGVYVEQWIGISTDEAHRVHESDVLYARHRYPLLELGMSRADCIRYLTELGWGETPKSACVGCPFHGNAMWRKMKRDDPADFADAVAFDASIRKGSARATAAGQELRGEMFLHRSRLPLDVAPIERVTTAEWKSQQGDLFADLMDPLAFEAMYEEDDLPGCSPFACRADSIVLGDDAA